ncbi:MAG: type IV toxin-antitoxin system AbiEi family antitoxin domain-containing protein [Acidobacteria bacterium]|nr:type IV toxin-antitoxin system AbiEi family antitoxin domain-containing protein [Acidobacteriota bacterium]
MAVQNERKLNQLERLLPEGLVVDANWLSQHHYSTSLRSHYISAGWLEQPARQVYRRKRGSLNWQQVVISLQTLLGQNLTVGGRTALETQGFAHYLTHETNKVHLYGPKHPPAWLQKLPLDVQFVYHNSQRTFRIPEKQLEDNVPPDTFNNSGLDVNPLPSDLVTMQWGQWGWKIRLSSPERALLELLDELPEHETFHQVDKLVEGLANLSPRRLENLLINCRSVKVKRLFFFFADRHRHAWLKRINKTLIDLGTGKRMLVRGGKLNAAYQITVPEDLDGA